MWALLLAFQSFLMKFHKKREILAYFYIRGIQKKKAYLYNTLSSTTTIPAAIIGYFVLDTLEFLNPFMLAISAASFIYIALSDLAPELHKKIGSKDYIKQLVLILLRVTLMAIILMFHTHSD